MSSDQRAEGERWIRQADQDMADAALAREHSRYNLACFMCQQSAEKAVKGFLYSRGAEDVWGHSLADLCEDAKLFEMLFDVLKSRAIFLDKHYHMTRYPSYLPGGIPSEAFDDLEAEWALQLAQEVVTFVKERMAEFQEEGH